MRILTIIDHLGPGGRQRTAQNFTLGYQEAGCDVAVLTLMQAGPRLDTLQQRGVPVFVGGPTASEQVAAIRGAEAWRPDVIHLHSEGPVRDFEARAVETLKAARDTHVPVLETTSFGKVDYQQRYTLTDVHLLMTRWILWRWRQWSRPLRPRPLGVIVPITADPSTFYPASPDEVAAFRKQFGLPDGAVVLGCVARPDPLKWPPLLFNAFEAVASAHPHVYFVVAGLAEAARPRVEAMPADVRHRFIELPFIQDDAALRTFYSAVDVFLHGSPIGESFGLVFVEALLSGTPVVTHSTPAKHNSQLEVVGHMRGGLIANDEAGMVSAVHQLVHDAPLRQRLARQGAAHVRAHYTQDQVIPALLQIAEIARETPERDALERRLVTEAGLVSEVSDEEVGALLDNTIGRVPLRQRILMRLVHTPAFIRPWWAYKSRRQQPPFLGPATP